MARFCIRSLWLLVLACSLAACSASDPEAFAEHFYETVAEGETEQALELFSYRDLQSIDASAARAKVAMMVGQMKVQIQAADGIDSVEVTKVTRPDDDHAHVEAILHMGDGSTQHDDLQLVREDGHWKVDLF